jgi:hypothetical protein
MDGKGLAILVLLFLIVLLLFSPQRSGYEASPVSGEPIIQNKTGGMIDQGGRTGPMIEQGGESSSPFAADIGGSPLAAFSSEETSGGSFKIGQVPTDPNVGLIPKEVVTTEDFGQFSPDAILSGQNFLDPRAQIGFPETLGGNLRNANRQERSEPANPRDPVSIFNLSTIPPDTMRPKFEIQNEYK